MLREDSSKQDAAPQKYLTLPLLKDLLAVLALGILAGKLLLAEFKFQLDPLSITDLVSLLLALFSIWLSVAFYFKANETSNQFYHQTHTFTKETSELLGRIESGLGERLTSIDKNYFTMREEFLHLYKQSVPSDLQGKAGDNGAKEEIAEIAKKETEITSREKELQAMVEGLMDRAKLNEVQKKQTRAELLQKERELEQLREELRQTQRRDAAEDEADIDVVVEGGDSARSHRKEILLIDFLVKAIKQSDVPFSGAERINHLQARVGFRAVRDVLPSRAIRDLAEIGLLGESGISNRAAFLIVQRWNSAGARK